MPQTLIALPLRRRGGLVARVLNAITVATLRRRERQHLAGLDAHLLRDIGLDPQTAEAEYAKPFWRD